MSYKKLVRDKIPDKILNNNEKPISRIMKVDEYKSELEKKLLEESKEVIEATKAEERIEELADVLEVVRALAKLENKTIEDIIIEANKKVEKLGSFDKRLFLIDVNKN